MDIEKKIIENLDKIRPYLQNDGGDIKFIKFENGTVYISLLGACSDCQLIDYTIKDGIEEMLVNEIPEVKEVVNIKDSE